jgi:16S rRNA (cytosine967-C5)-methyltransferase
LKKGARYIAIEILCKWEESRLPMDQLMEQYIANKGLGDPRDRQLIIALVYGVMCWRRYLDWVVEKFSKHPLSKMKSRTLQALRIGIYQLLFLDRVPASAAINETVQALKDTKQPKWLTGFVNGLLRTVSRQQETIADPRDEKKTALLPETARLSHPDWLIKRWQKQYGRAVTETICLQNNLPAPLCLRTNTTLIPQEELLERLRRANINAVPGKFGPEAVLLPDYQGPISKLSGYTEGLFQVQDEAAQLVSLLLHPMKPERYYLDGCAGLGGKASHLAQHLPDDSHLFAAEPHIGRIKKLKENLPRLQLDRPVTIVEDEVAALLPDMQETFDGVLIDAPCSGLGVIRRHPDIRWNRKPTDLLRYQDIQLSLLESAAKLLTPGGILVYATCSTEPEENDQVIDKFLAQNHTFQVANCKDALPDAASILVDPTGFFKTLPGQQGMDGFFAAKLLKSK